jgi:carbon-monoxide dehydrogenase large subunit
VLLLAAQALRDKVLTIAAYLLATARRSRWSCSHTPTRHTPTGSKGISEGGLMGAIGVPSAVNDALAPFGVVVESQPLSPMYLRQSLRGRGPRRQAASMIPCAGVPSLSSAVA